MIFKTCVILFLYSFQCFFQIFSNFDKTRQSLPKEEFNDVILKEAIAKPFKLKKNEKLKVHQDTVINNSVYKSNAHLDNRIFFKKIDFHLVKMEDQIIFNNSEFKDNVSFINCIFEKGAEFINCVFEDTLGFTFIESNGKIEFENTKFNSAVFFQDFINNGAFDFYKATFNGPIFLMSAKQYYDFSMSIMGEEVEIHISDFVKIKIDSEKIPNFQIPKKFSYREKKAIVSYLKAESFKNDKKAHFELEYLLHKSTMYQKSTDEYAEAGILLKSGQWLYFVTMGLGYRPFLLIWWGIVFIIFFSLIYFFISGFSDNINAFIKMDSPSNVQFSSSRLEQFIYCFYFSAMLLFTLRFKKELFYTFSAGQKIAIIIEWLFGTGIYMAFIFGSKSGSILHTLKSVFVG